MDENQSFDLNAIPDGIGWDDEPEEVQETTVTAEESAPEADVQAEQPTTERDAGEVEAQPEQQAQAEAQPQTYSIKYNGQTMALSLEQLTALAQKGMNYDKIHQRMEQAESSPALELVRQLAAMSGLSVDDYIDKANGNMESQWVQDMVNRGLKEEQARELWADKQRLAKLDAAEHQRQTQQTQQEADESAKRQEADALLAAYPNLRQYPEEAVKIREGNPGETMLSAYRLTEVNRLTAENNQLKAELAAAKRAASNRQTAPGSAAGVGSSAEKPDPFLEGWG